MKRNLTWITEAVCGKLISPQGKEAAESIMISGISIDSRNIDKGSLFIPIIGERYDAHDFLQDAIEAGSRAVFFSDEGKFAKNVQALCEERGVFAIQVSDTVKALQDLARRYLAEVNPIRIGVTGSVGKTSTKDMLLQICSKFALSYANDGNFNNHIGLPLTVLAMPENTEVLILEMGMDKFGEIAFLADMVMPDIAVITLIGESHLENLKTRENILKAKLEITSRFDGHNILIVNADSDLLTDEAIGRTVPDLKGELVKVGSGESCDYIISDICEFGEKGIKFIVSTKADNAEVELPVLGVHNAKNAALAMAAACCVQEIENSDAGSKVKIDLHSAAKALNDVELTGRRLSCIKLGKIDIIDDSYNASPKSMTAAIDVLAALPAVRRVAILGDMYELGEDSSEMHEAVGKYAAEKGINLIITVGELAEDIGYGVARHMATNIFSGADSVVNLGVSNPLEALASLAKSGNATCSEPCGAADTASDDLLEVMHFEDKNQLMGKLASIIREGDRVLIKASNSMGLQEIAEYLKEIG